MSVEVSEKEEEGGLVEDKTTYVSLAMSVMLATGVSFRKSKGLPCVVVFFSILELLLDRREYIWKWVFTHNLDWWWDVP